MVDPMAGGNIGFLLVGHVVLVKARHFT